LQDRYAGDIGDYLKLALLRALMPGRTLGVAWWLFPDESRNGNGRHTGYLRAPEKWRGLDAKLFDFLGRVVDGGARCVSALQDPGLFEGAVFFDEAMPIPEKFGERKAARAEWFDRALATLSKCDLVFVDPDNGLEPTGFSHGSKNAGKSITLDELRDLNAPGRTVVAYHHQTRRGGGHLDELACWAERLKAHGFQCVDAVRARSYSPRLFFLLNASETLRQRACELVTSWPQSFSWYPDRSAPPCSG
jgi:hypothetical protein